MTTPSPAGIPPTAPAAPQVAARPEYVPENFWDATKGEVKGEDLTKHLNDLTAFKAADDSRRLSLPQKADDYALEMPKDFVVPQGLEFKLDPADPMLGKGREFALKHGLTKDGFSELLGLYGSMQVGTQQEITAARAAEVGKLGAAGPARVTAINTWLDAKGFADLKPMLVTAKIAETFERLMQHVNTQGGGSLNGNRQDHANGKLDPAVYEKLSFSQKRNYQRTGDPNKPA